jgi:hypothetical protein
MGAAPVGHFGKKKCQGRSERLDRIGARIPRIV